MSKITASITTSVDGYITGPNDGPGRGLGEGGTALHSWVFGGPWLDEAMQSVGSVVAGRRTYEAADHWGSVRPSRQGRWTS